MNIFQPPHLPEFSKEDFENVDWEKVKQNPAVQKYEKRLAEQKQRKVEEQLKRKQEQRSEWWRNNWVPFVAMIFAFISALPYIIQGIETILKWLKLLN